MRKSLVTLLVSLALCGAGTAAVIAATVQAEAPRKPVMVAMVTPTPQRHDDAAPPDAGGGRGPRPDRAMPSAAQLAAFRSRMCNDRYARAAGQIAYLEARLSLTPAQTGAFTAWKDIRLSAAKHRADSCAAQPGPRAQNDRANRGPGRGATPPNPADRMAREETRLKARLADLEAERPALQSLYSSLTPAQRQLFGQHRREGGMRGGMRQRFAMAGPMGMRGRGMDMGPRPMGGMGRRGGPGGADGQTPPPPPQP